MPRLPFKDHWFSICTIRSRRILCVLTALMVGHALAATAAPVPVIQSTVTAGMAPFTVHAHGLNSTLGVGSDLTARYEWTFGDANGQFNTLVGWNAAHIYDQPGTYTITLRVIDQLGAAAVATKQVMVTADLRSVIYVSDTGNDANSGSSPSAPIRTVARAAQLVGNNMSILFRRGGTFATDASLSIGASNVVIGAYGTGARPKLWFTSGAYYASIINTGTSAQNVVIQDLEFNSSLSPNNLIVRGIIPHGSNITVRGCYFGNISYAMNTGGGGVYGWLALNNTAGVIGAYYAWCEGADHVHIGNTVAGSIDEHNIRMVVSRILISNNDLTNLSKSSIWCMQGDHAYVSNNKLRTGRFIAGPNFAAGNASDRFKRLIFEGNEIFNANVVCYSGAEDMSFRNNVVHSDNSECFSIWGYISSYDRTTRNINVCNNTGTNYGTSYGRFAKLGSGVVNTCLANNMYVAPALNANDARNIVSDDGNLNNISSRNNLWAKPSSMTYVHALSNGSQTVNQWAAYAQTTNEQYRAFSAADLNAQFRPQFNAVLGVAEAGVMRDYMGNQRPLSGACTVGAVELNPSEPPPPPPPPNPGDIDGNGIVNVQDLFILIAEWGHCGGSPCLADVNHDGTVNGDDLAIVLSGWG